MVSSAMFTGARLNPGPNLLLECENHVRKEQLGITLSAKLSRVRWTERLSSNSNQQRSSMRITSLASVTNSSAVPSLALQVQPNTPTHVIRDLRLVTAIKTPYLSDGRFDLKAYDEAVVRQVDAGVEGLIVGGTTGEGQLMSWDEHIMLIAHTVSCFGSCIKVIGNTGSNSTREAIRATEQGFAVGMHAALQINPYYGKTSHEGLLAHFRSLLSFGPTILYNVPGRTGQDIPQAVVEALAGNKNFAGVKECMGNARVQAYTDQGMAIWSGNDDQCHDARWQHGARGVISVVSNLVPKLMHRLIIEEKDPELNQKLMPLINWLFVEPNPIGLNTACAMLGLSHPTFRLPYVPLSIERRREFVNIVESIGLEHFTGARWVKEMKDEDFTLISRH